MHLSQLQPLQRQDEKLKAVRNGRNLKHRTQGKSPLVGLQVLTPGWCAGGEWWGHHPWMCSRTVEMWHLGTRPVSVVEWAGVGMEDLGGLFQP